MLPEPPDYQLVAHLGDVPPGMLRRARLADGWIVLANVGGTCFAFEDRCLHWGIKLSQGRLDGQRLTCRLHAWTYDLPTGVVADADDDTAIGACLTTFPIRVVGDSILVSPTPYRPYPAVCAAPPAPDATRP